MIRRSPGAMTPRGGRRPAPAPPPRRSHARPHVTRRPQPDRPTERVAAVSVSFNTRELTGFLLWSLRRIVHWPGLEIVIVDNGSRDGSAELLAEAGQA